MKKSTLIFLIIFIASISGIFWYIQNKEASPPNIEPIGKLPMLLPEGSFSTTQPKNKVEIKRTDTLEQVRDISLLNSDSRGLFQVYLQTWNIVPPKELVNDEFRYWGHLAASSRNLINWIIQPQGYQLFQNVKGEERFVRLEEKLKYTPDISVNTIKVNQGELGNSIWSALREEKKPFIVILPKEISKSKIEEGALGDILTKYGLVAYNRKDVVVISPAAEAQ